MKKIFFLAILASFSVIFLLSCGGDKNKSTEATTSETPATEGESAATTAEYDPHRGEGKFHDVVLSDKLDAPLAEKGEKIAGLKCESCHKLSDERLVGPGWKGVTTRHKPEWILNFITNTDAMIDKDPKAQAMLEICLVRMPNQSLSDDEAHAILEFMRKNDGVK